MVLAAIGGVLAGCGVIPSGIGFFAVLLIVGLCEAVARRADQPRHSGTFGR